LLRAHEVVPPGIGDRVDLDDGRGGHNSNLSTRPVPASTPVSLGATMERLDPGGQLAEEWEELAERVSASPFVRPGWFEAWSEAFGSGPLLAVTARNGS